MFIVVWFGDYYYYYYYLFPGMTGAFLAKTSALWQLFSTPPLPPSLSTGKLLTLLQLASFPPYFRRPAPFAFQACPSPPLWYFFPLGFINWHCSWTAQCDCEPRYPEERLSRMCKVMGTHLWLFVICDSPRKSYTQNQKGTVLEN